MPPKPTTKAAPKASKGKINPPKAKKANTTPKKQLESLTYKEYLVVDFVQAQANAFIKVFKSSPRDAIFTSARHSAAASKSAQIFMGWSTLKAQKRPRPYSTALLPLLLSVNSFLTTPIFPLLLRVQFCQFHAP
ncbi:hypothetical protein DSO57_1012186 [Entomophthora muscae]|uniref:Uncharacterized protein n=1 Tax=Entomophthora muscae TaxID=34485 RepID=A0ACC2THI4_9FUNG|nr:hypothetical protein DSO57_1012186 [Entomophthora muscae]